MNEKAIVIGLDGDSASIEVIRTKACGSCKMCDSLDQSKMIGKAVNRANAKVGDAVSVEIVEGSLIGAAAIVYLFPLAMFFSGYAIFYQLAKILDGPKDISGFIGAALMLVAAFVIVMFYDKRIKRKGKFQLTITRVFER
jgi:positive regulator of sigma E activity